MRLLHFSDDCDGYEAVYFTNSTKPVISILTEFYNDIHAWGFDYEVEIDLSNFFPHEDVLYIYNRYKGDGTDYESRLPTRCVV